MSGPDETDEPAGDEAPEPVEPVEHRVKEDHDPTGLDLADRLARSLRGVRAAPKRRRPRQRQVPAQSSGAHPDDRDPQPLGEAIGRLMKTQGWSTRIDVHRVLAHWPTIVGEVNAEHSIPERFEDGVLTVRAHSTTWAASLRLMAPQIVARLAQELGEGAVTRVEVVGPTGPSWKKGRRSVPGRGPRDTYG